MLSFDEAREKIMHGIACLDTEKVPLSEASGRVLGAQLTAQSPLPPRNYSAMDGYALRLADLSGEGPWSLPVIGESRTGHPTPTLSPASVVRIFTGATLPAGADTVEMQENVTRRGDNASFEQRPKLGRHIRRAGEDLATGSVALEAGTRIGPFALSLLGALDLGELEVRRLPRVHILATGDELRDPGSPATPGSIPESNGLTIAALAKQAGAEVTRWPRSGDDRDATPEAVKSALKDCDLLVTIGGVSVGDHDHVRPALEAAGVNLEFWKVAIKPGKPLVLGNSGATRVLGLPGNPVSAMITFALFGLPLLRALQGCSRISPSLLRGTLTCSMTQKPGRHGFYAARLDGDQLTPLSNQSSGSTVNLAWADVLIQLPAEADGANAGDAVDYLRIAEL